MRKSLLVLFGALSIGWSAIAAPADIDPTTSWTEFANYNGVKVEYKFQECNSGLVQNQVLVLFRYTNETTEAKELLWKVKMYRDNECINCDLLDNPEYGHTLQLAPGEVVEGDGTSKSDARVYIFSHFVNLVPGMSDSKLTDFEFVNVASNTTQP